MPPRSIALPVVEQSSDNGLVVHGFLLGDRSLTPLGTPTRAQWQRCLVHLLHRERHIQFWIGELLRYGIERWGRGWVEEIIEEKGYDRGTLHTLSWVAGQVEPEERREGLSFAHHQEVAKLPREQQRLVLDRAEREGWSHRQVRQETYRLTRTKTQSETPGSPNPGLHHGDCRGILDQLPDQSVHLLLTDPPYGINFESPGRIVPFMHMCNDGEDEACQVVDELLEVAASKLAPTALLYLFGSWKTYLRMVEVIESHFPVIGTLTWVKNQFGVGDLMGGYGDQQELIIVAYSGPRPRGGYTDALHFDRVGTNLLEHPTQKPVPLLRYLIERSVPTGALVVDPFMGSGSTCVAAAASGRNYLGIEIDRQWYDVAQRRLAGLEEE